MKSYFDQLIDSFPEKAEMLEWIKGPLDDRVLYYGQNFIHPFEAYSLKLSMRWKLARLYRRYKTSNLDYRDAVISNAYFNVGEMIKKKGFKVLPPPWETGLLSKDGNKTVQCLYESDFNYLLSDDFMRRIYALKEELISFFNEHKTSFLLLSNDMVAMHRIAIDVCKEIGVPTGIFLHGLPGRYNSVDDSRADYLFVWGDRIKENYANVGSKTNIVVSGHPNFSTYKIEKSAPCEILVLTRVNSNSPSRSDKYNVEDRGICLQFVYSVEKVLKEIGYKKAKLRLHPSENPNWYKKYIDEDFYYIDNDNLKTSLQKAEMVIGGVSTVILDTVLNGIPYYVYNINKEIDSKSEDLVPPFNAQSDMPVASSQNELESNLLNKRYVTAKHIDGYIAPRFDIDSIVNLIK